MFAIILIIACYGSFVSSQSYSRALLQQMYPTYGTDWVPMGLDENGEFIIGYLTKPDARFSLSPEPSEVVTFTLYTRQHPNGTLIKGPIKSYEKIFDKTKPVKSVTHGWMSSGSADTCITIKDGFLKKYDANVFIMDWSEISGNVFYPIPMSATTGVANHYSKFLNSIVSFGVDPSNFHLVGHSLGAHITGFAARAVKKGKIGRVTGLDPALPGFDNIELVDGGRLRNEDALFVDVIHTAAGYLGLKSSIGDVDFYPNGGSVPQPGCESVFEMIEACSHGRSWVFFAESLKSSIPFMAYPCQSFEAFINKEKCKNEDGIPMGDDTPRSAKGDYYLRTDDKAPFAVKNIEEKINNAIENL